MLTINDKDGVPCNLSDEIYTLKTDSVHRIYNGPVRLISGVEGSTVPGYHWEAGWVTVCPVGVAQARHLGVLRTEISK